MSTDADGFGERVAAIEGTVGQMNERLGTIENRIGSIETRMDSVENRMDSLDGRMDRLDGKIDALRRDFRRWVAVAATVVITFLAAIQVVVAIAL
jgi:archaellum component FlaC